MSEASSGSDYCRHALATAGASKCGKPQRKIMKCVQCAKEVTDSGTFCVHCGHDQWKLPTPPETKPCISCHNELSSSTTVTSLEATLRRSLSATSASQSSTTVVDTTVPEATLNHSLRSATSAPQLSTTITVPETSVEEDVNKSKNNTMGPVDDNSITSSMEVDTSKRDTTSPSLNPCEPRDESPIDPSSTPDISSNTSSVDKDVTDEQGLDIDDECPVGSKRLSDDESASEHSKRSKTDKDPDHETIVVPSRRISKKQLSNEVPPSDQVKRSKTEEDLTAKEKVTESDSGINISDNAGHTPSENNGKDDSEK